MEQTINDLRADARRYQAFRWVMCASEQDRALMDKLLEPLLGNSDEPTPALLDAAMDALADHLATL